MGRGILKSKGVKTYAVLSAEPLFFRLRSARAIMG